MCEKLFVPRGLAEEWGMGVHWGGRGAVGEGCGPVKLIEATECPPQVTLGSLARTNCWGSLPSLSLCGLGRGHLPPTSTVFRYICASPREIPKVTQPCSASLALAYTPTLDQLSEWTSWSREELPALSCPLSQFSDCPKRGREGRVRAGSGPWGWT